MSVIIQVIPIPTYMAALWFMALVITIIHGMVITITRVPSPGDSVCIIIPGPVGDSPQGIATVGSVGASTPIPDGGDHAGTVTVTGMVITVAIIMVIIMGRGPVTERAIWLPPAIHQETFTVIG